MARHHIEEAAHDVIRIVDLRVQARIGIHDFERERPQTLRFDIEMETVAGYLDQVQASGRYVSYSDAIDFIEAKAAAPDHVDLVEEWAASVAEFALQNPLVAQVSVSVTKPDIYAQAEGVGIRLVRRRASAP
ncbi:MAG: dihydroneopterin aldolase [Pseudomonadota bacterium]